MNENLNDEELQNLKEKDDTEVKTVQKDQWGNDIEFLLSCITLSVGLGNVWRFARNFEIFWCKSFLIIFPLFQVFKEEDFSLLATSWFRFPFTALENGGGTFVVPYTFIVILVGRPLYYMELLLGQFSSKGCIKVYDMVPAVRGVGIGQCFCTLIVLTIYASVMALTIRFFLASFNDPLPWSMCKDEWNTTCIDSSLKADNFSGLRPKSSAELFFV